MHKPHKIVSALVAIVALALPLASIGSTTPASAGESNPAGSTSTDERRQCDASNTSHFGEWDLRRGGDKFPGIGGVFGDIRESPSNPDKDRFCFFTKHGWRTAGDERLTVIEVGTQPRNAGASHLLFWDRDPDATLYSDGRGITPGYGMCVVFHGKIKHNGKIYEVWGGKKTDYWCN